MVNKAAGHYKNESEVCLASDLFIKFTPIKISNESHRVENQALILGHANVQKKRRYQPTRQRPFKYGIVNEGIEKI